MTTAELAERIAKRLSTELVGCKIGLQSTQDYARDIIIEELNKANPGKVPPRDPKKGYEI